MIQFCKAYRKEPEDISEMEFARSKSGHDKNQIYLIKEKDEKFVYLVNGTTRTLDMPKKKNAKHIQIIKNLPIEVTEILHGKYFLHQSESSTDFLWLPLLLLHGQTAEADIPLLPTVPCLLNQVYLIP